MRFFKQRRFQKEYNTVKDSKLFDSDWYLKTYPDVVDDKQLEVIRFNNGHALVLGAPGCGKTDILSVRVLFSHQVYNVNYKDMLCLTFTNRASREMKERIKKTVGDVMEDLFVGNLHRFCIRFIYENDLVPIDVGIADDTEQEEIITELIGDLQVPGWQIMKITNKRLKISL